MLTPPRTGTLFSSLVTTSLKPTQSPGWSAPHAASIPSPGRHPLSLPSPRGLSEVPCQKSMNAGPRENGKWFLQNTEPGEGPPRASQTAPAEGVSTSDRGAAWGWHSGPQWTSACGRHRGAPGPVHPFTSQASIWPPARAGVGEGARKGGALKGTPPLLLPPAGMSRREHQALRAAEKAPGRTEELLEGRRAGTGPSLPGMPFHQGRIPGHQG